MTTTQGEINMDWDDDAPYGTCDHCGHQAKIEELKDPYILELYPEDPNEPSWWCYDCYHEASMDI